MKRTEVTLESIITSLEGSQTFYEDFFPLLRGCEDYIKLYDGIDESSVEYIEKIEMETMSQFPEDLIEFLVCSNGAMIGDLTIFPLQLDDETVSIYNLTCNTPNYRKNLNVPSDYFVLGSYTDSDLILICGIDGEKYEYALYDPEEKKKIVKVDYLAQFIHFELEFTRKNINEVEPK